jgi:hypothetical protein
MSRPNLLGASAVIGCASLILMLALLITQGAAARAPTSPPTAARSLSGPTVIAPEDPNCFAWDFANYTGEDVDGLMLHLQGHHAVSAIYTDTLNPFFGLDAGYEGGTDSYRLVFTDGLAYDSDLVHVGLCTDLAYARLSAAPHALDWTQGISSIVPAPLMAGVELNWLSADQLTVNLVNEQAVTVTLDTFLLLDAEVALPLTDLTGDIAATLPLAGEAITEPIALAPNAAYSVTFEGLLRGHGYVVDARLSAEDDAFNSVRVLAQTALPPYRTYLPLLSK